MTSPTEIALRPWCCKLTDGWWCVFDSTGALLAKFLHEGDCRTFMRLAGPPQPDHREAA